MEARVRRHLTQRRLPIPGAGDCPSARAPPLQMKRPPGLLAPAGSTLNRASKLGKNCRQSPRLNPCTQYPRAPRSSSLESPSLTVLSCRLLGVLRSWCRDCSSCTPAPGNRGEPHVSSSSASSPQPVSLHAPGDSAGAAHAPLGPRARPTAGLATSPSPGLLRAACARPSASACARSCF